MEDVEADLTPRKKFRKMKHKFDAAMQQSNELFIQEQHALKTAKRLAQENELANTQTLFEQQADTI